MGKKKESEVGKGPHDDLGDQALHRIKYSVVGCSRCNIIFWFQRRTDWMAV